MKIIRSTIFTIATFSGAFFPLSANASVHADEFSMSRQRLEKAGYLCSPATDAVKLMFSYVCRHATKVGNELGFRANEYEVSIGKNGSVDAVKARLQIASARELTGLMISVARIYPRPAAGGPLVYPGLRSEIWCDDDGSAAEIYASLTVAPGLLEDTYAITYYRPNVIGHCARTSEQAKIRSIRP